MRKNAHRDWDLPQEGQLRYGQKEETWPVEQPYDTTLRSVLASPEALHWVPGEKPATADPSQPAFRSTWNGTIDANLSLMNLLLHILRWPFVFGGVLDAKNRLNFMYFFLLYLKQKQKKPNYVFPTQLLSIKIF